MRTHTHRYICSTTIIRQRIKAEAKISWFLNFQFIIYSFIRSTFAILSWRFLYALVLDCLQCHNYYVYFVLCALILILCCCKCVKLPFPILTGTLCCGCVIFLLLTMCQLVEASTEIRLASLFYSAIFSYTNFWFV